MSEGEQNPFKILRDYFRNQLIKYFDTITHTKNLIVDESLLGVVEHLINPPPDSCKVFGYSSLVGHRVSHTQDII